MCSIQAPSSSSGSHSFIWVPRKSATNLDQSFHSADIITCRIPSDGSAVRGHQLLECLRSLCLKISCAPVFTNESRDSPPFAPFSSTHLSVVNRTLPPAALVKSQLQLIFASQQSRADPVMERYSLAPDLLCLRSSSTSDSNLTMRYGMRPRYLACSYQYSDHHYQAETG